MNSTGRTGSQAARAATLLAPNTTDAVNAIDKTERYIGLSRLILLSPVCAGFTIHRFTYALVAVSFPPEIAVAFADRVVKADCREASRARHPRLWDNRGTAQQGNSPIRWAILSSAQTVLMNCTFHPRGRLLFIPEPVRREFGIRNASRQSAGSLHSVAAADLSQLLWAKDGRAQKSPGKIRGCKSWEEIERTAGARS